MFNNYFYSVCGKKKKPGELFQPSDDKKKPKQLYFPAAIQAFGTQLIKVGHFNSIDGNKWIPRMHGY